MYKQTLRIYISKLTKEFKLMSTNITKVQKHFEATRAQHHVCMYKNIQNFHLYSTKGIQYKYVFDKYFSIKKMPFCVLIL